MQLLYLGNAVLLERKARRDGRHGGGQERYGSAARGRVRGGLEAKQVMCWGGGGVDAEDWMQAVSLRDEVCES